MDGREAPADGVITGYGHVDGRPVAVAAYDFTVMAGSMGMTGEIKVTRLRELALTKRIPIVWLLDSRGRAHPGGGRLAVRRHRPPVPRGGRDERRRPAGRGADGPVRGGHRVHPRARRLRADGAAGAARWRWPARTSCARRSARTSRRRSSAARACTAASPASATSRSPTTRSASRAIKRVPVVLPVELRAGAAACAPCTDPVDRMEEALLDVLPESNRKPYDMYDVIKLIVDDGEWLDLKPQVGAHDHHLPRAHGRAAGRDRRLAAAPPRRHPRQRLGRQGRALRQPVRRVRDPARVPRRRAGLHGRHEGRGGGDHPPRREDAARGRVRHGAQDHGRRCARPTARATT